MQIKAETSAQKVTYSNKNASIQQVFEQIRRQTGYNVLWATKSIANQPSRSVSFKDAPLAEVLNKTLEGLPLFYSIEDKTILIREKEIPIPSTKEFAKKYEAKTVIIRGLVTDSSGTPLVGVSVKVLGAEKTVITDARGYYLIQANKGEILEFNHIGYKTKKVTVGDATEINIQMTEEVALLSDVVMVGYGSQRRKDLTGSVSSVRMEDAQKAPVTNYVDALAGRVAGVNVSASDGQPGSVPNIVIRGASSVTQSNEPLYVVDGFPLEDGLANSLNMDDIESIDVLKDASATAIYGARGANGVIVITTKKGKAGTNIVDFNMYYGLQRNPRQIKMMDAYDYVKFQQQNLSSTDTTYINSRYPTLDAYKSMPTLNLQGQFFRTGNIQNYNVAVRGGNNKTRYSISGNYLDQQGIIITSGFKRMQGRMTLDQKISDKFRVGANVNYAYSRSSGAPVAQPGVATGLSSTNPSTGLLYAV